jgi:hypothetical protein
MRLAKGPSRRHCSSLRSFLNLSLRMPDQPCFSFFSWAVFPFLPSFTNSLQGCLGKKAACLPTGRTNRFQVASRFGTLIHSQLLRQTDSNRQGSWQENGNVRSVHHCWLLPVDEQPGNHSGPEVGFAEISPQCSHSRVASPGSPFLDSFRVAIIHPQPVSLINRFLQTPCAAMTDITSNAEQTDCCEIIRHCPGL